MQTFWTRSLQSTQSLPMNQTHRHNHNWMLFYVLMVIWSEIILQNSKINILCLCVWFYKYKYQYIWLQFDKYKYKYDKRPVWIQIYLSWQTLWIGILGLVFANTNPITNLGTNIFKYKYKQDIRPTVCLVDFRPRYFCNGLTSLWLKVASLNSSSQSFFIFLLKLLY